MENTKRSNKNLILNIVLFVGGIIASGVASYLYHFELIRIVTNVIIFGIMSLLVIFALEKEKCNSRLLFDNINHLSMFYSAYFIFLVVSLFFPLLSNVGWPYLVIFITLAIVSNEFVGFTAGFALLVLNLILCPETSFIMLLVYLVPGFVSVMLFGTLDENFKVASPMSISLLVQFVTLSLSNVLLANMEFSISLFLVPAINIFICTVLLLIVLKVLSFSLVYKTHDRYMEILDPEFELLVQLKNFSKEEYNHTIYTAVLCTKLASKLSLDENLTKALGYYHRIGLIRGDNSWECVSKLLNEYDIPGEVSALLKEYLDKDSYVISKEIGVLMFADTVVSAISYLFSKDKDTQINFDKLINTVFDKKLASGVLANSKVSFYDISVMKKVLIEEKLFYDFLR